MVSLLCPIQSNCSSVPLKQKTSEKKKDESRSANSAPKKLHYNQAKKAAILDSVARSVSTFGRIFEVWMTISSKRFGKIEETFEATWSTSAYCIIERIQE